MPIHVKQSDLAGVFLSLMHLRTEASPEVKSSTEHPLGDFHHPATKQGPYSVLAQKRQTLYVQLDSTAAQEMVAYSRKWAFPLLTRLHLIYHVVTKFQQSSPLMLRNTGVTPT